MPLPVALHAFQNQNEADQKKFFNVTFTRSHMDQAKNFHDTDTYVMISLVAKLAD